MNRRELAIELGSNIGLDPKTEAQAAVLTSLICAAAQEIYTQTDLPRSLVEEVFSVDTDPTERVSLPQRVGELRAVRVPNGKITLHDIRPRYNDYPWPKESCFVHRILGESAICRSIDNAISLYLVPTEGTHTVTVIGSTDTSAELHVTYQADGTPDIEDVNWTDIAYILQSAEIDTDTVLRVGDANGLEIARINAQTKYSRYLEIQLDERARSTPVTQHNFRCFDILYKPTFKPLVKDTSVFQLSGYDQPIILTAMKNYRIGKLGDTATADQIQAAKVHAVRADELLNTTIQDKIQGEEIVVQFGRPRGDIRNLRGLRARRYSVGAYRTR